jgi:hypothetical protein
VFDTAHWQRKNLDKYFINRVLFHVYWLEKGRWVQLGRGGSRWGMKRGGRGGRDNHCCIYCGLNAGNPLLFIVSLSNAEGACNHCVIQLGKLGEPPQGLRLSHIHFTSKQQMPSCQPLPTVVLYSREILARLIGTIFLTIEGT